jgi:hypothetical protein
MVTGQFARQIEQTQQGILLLAGRGQFLDFAGHEGTRGK